MTLQIGELGCFAAAINQTRIDCSASPLGARRKLGQTGSVGVGSDDFRVGSGRSKSQRLAPCPSAKVQNAQAVGRLAGQRDQLATFILYLDQAVGEGGMAIDAAVGSQANAPRTQAGRQRVLDLTNELLAVCPGDIHPNVERRTLKQGRPFVVRHMRASEILRAEGEKQAKILQAEGLKEAAFREAEARERSAQAEAAATKSVSDAIEGGSAQAINYFIAQKYVEAIGMFATSPNAKTILFPVEATQLMGTLGGIGELAREVLGKDAPKTPAIKSGVPKVDQ